MKLISRIVPDSGNHQARDTTVPATLILHTNGAGHSVASLHDYIINTGTRIYPHVQVAWDGTIEQYCPFDKQAYVQYDGNRYAVSAETQDSGYLVKPIDRDPWTDDQLHAFAELALFLGVAPHPCTSPTSGGIGFHSQFRNEWNRDGHNCPGSARRDQIPQILAYMTAVVVADVHPPVQGDDMKFALVRKKSTGQINVFAADGLGFHVASMDVLGKLQAAGLVEDHFTDLDDVTFDSLTQS